MSSQGDATLPATRRSRKSIGGGPSNGRENSTLDVGSTMNASRKKTRSKSMGPGGLDILKMGNGNRRASLAVPSVPPPRSILKPTLPLPEIPTFKPKEPTSSNESTGTKVALRTEEEQQAAAREREERERAQLEKDIKDRREARRKSLANRRVSFAAEATLHTFHEVDENQDATNSTNPTDRGAPPPQHYDAPDSDPPSPDHESIYGEDDTITSTVYDSDMEHGDDVAEMEGDEMTGSSDSDDDGTIMTVEAEEMTSASVASMTSARSGFDENETTGSGSLDENLRLAQQRAATQRIDEDEEVIAGFGGWGKKQQSRAQESATQIIQSMAPSHTIATHDRDEGSDMEMDMDADMDMTKAVGGILRSETAPLNIDEDQDMEVDEGMEMEMEMDMSMDVTKALGGIIFKPKAQTRRKSVLPVPSQDEEDSGEQTMEFTTAVGGIRAGRVSEVSVSNFDSNEDMSMEFTAALGGFLSKGTQNSGIQANRRRTVAPEDNDGMEMDMTMGAGRILPTAQMEQEDEEDEDQTMGMDITTAVGGILQSVTPAARSAAKRAMEAEVDQPDPSITTSVEITTSPKRQASTSDENVTLGLSAFQGQGLRRSMPGARRASRSPERVEPESSPLKSSPIKSSPLKSSPLKSSPVRSSPVRKSPVRNTRASPARRTPSPARNIPQEPRPPSSLVGSSSPIRAAVSPPKTTPRSGTKGKLFNQDPNTGINTPRVVLTPQGRRLSGVGADRPGLGSPRVAEILDRRESLGDSATAFVPSGPANPRRAVAFSDPKIMEAEVNKELEEEYEKENNRRILEREVNGSQDDRETTLNLKEMIQNLSPKKNPLRGRKSLHVGSARGLLGKRIFDSDEEEDSEEVDGVKRLKGHQGSPVKNIRLKSPPSKEETITGRKTLSDTRHGDENETSTPVVHSSPQRATTPRNGRFKAVDDQPAPVPDFENTASLDEAEITQERDDDGERITLQDFLNLTSIRFMELNTTKRRHTVAPGEGARLSFSSDGKEDLSLERCVVAGACTVPQLEMYQHACRELKKYISEGRSIVREIENEVFEENPPLFREYMTATPEFKVLMDNQFKNVKSHARLLSKAMWYEWRMQLQGGLLDGLLKISEGMDDDEKFLQKEQEQLSSVLPELVKRHEALLQQSKDLKEAEQELANVDPAELEEARAELSALDLSIADKTKKIAALRREVEEYDQGIDEMTNLKQQYLDEIKEADKVRKECRGWTSEEVNKLKAQTDKIEKKSGWAVTGISGTTISMSYRRQIELVFDTAAFQQRKDVTQTNPNAPVDLWYIADKTKEPNHAVPSTPEKEFFLQCIRDYARSLPQASTRPNHLVEVVAVAWDQATAVANWVRLLNLTFPTTVKRTSDSTIAVISSVLLVPLQTRVEVLLNLRVDAQASEREKRVVVEVVPEAKVVYGEQFNVGKMTDFLMGKVGGRVGEAKEGKLGWDEGVLELYKRLLAKGAKAAQK
ncbi:putative kinetochore protein spc7 [Podospora australis]|uniref:Kinetochore protein spc7 n=1 Tax=Podospora australis TaxID=1536484 RepID=A0AAN6X2X4_9PEZI|nr:putative kinetochore protein spc7 [Podospora australis]